MDDRAYFTMRSMQERSAADNALDAGSQAVHLDLALRYERLAEEAAEADARTIPELSAAVYLKT